MKRYKNVCNCRYKTNKLLILALLWVGISSCSIIGQSKDSSGDKLPITYKIDGGNYYNIFGREGTQIESLEVQIESTKRKNEREEFKITYQVRGQVVDIKNIEQVHVAEYFNYGSDRDCDRIVEITPLIKYRKGFENLKPIEVAIPFNFKNEYRTTINIRYLNPKRSERVKFICGDKEQIIELK